MNVTGTYLADVFTVPRWLLAGVSSPGVLLVPAVAWALNTAKPWWNPLHWHPLDADIMPSRWQQVESEWFNMNHVQSFNMFQHVSLATQAFVQTLSNFLFVLKPGLNHTLAMTAAGKLLVWGTNERGQLGLGTPGDAGVQPTVLKAVPWQKQKVTDIAAGALHSLCIAGVFFFFNQGLAIWSKPLEQSPSNTFQKTHVPKHQLAFSFLQGLETCHISSFSFCPRKRSVNRRVPGDSGQVFAWGCNAHGALGLGPPPTGPSYAAQPQGLPHIKSATLLVANPCGHVTICCWDSFFFFDATALLPFVFLVIFLSSLMIVFFFHGTCSRMILFFHGTGTCYFFPHLSGEGC